MYTLCSVVEWAISYVLSSVDSDSVRHSSVEHFVLVLHSPWLYLPFIQALELRMTRIELNMLHVSLTIVSMCWRLSSTVSQWHKHIGTFDYKWKWVYDVDPINEIELLMSVGPHVCFLLGDMGQYWCLLFRGREGIYTW